MKIYLFLMNKVCVYSVSKKISGNFNFDYDEEEESRLINVEVKDENCILYSTEDVKIINNNVIQERVVLQDNTFYTLQRNNVQYLIYTSNLDFDKMSLYTYDNRLNLNIGYSANSNIKYQCIYLNNKNVNISFKENKLMLDNPNNVAVYVNKKHVLSKSFEVSFGSEIFIYGLSIIVLKGILLIKNNTNLTIDIASASISNFNFPNLGQMEDINIKDVDLYTDDDYFSKSPRLKRVIEYNFPD